MHLRQACRVHIDAGTQPRLRLCEGYRLGGDSTARAILNDVVVRRLQEVGGDSLHALADSFTDSEALLMRYREEGLTDDADIQD